MVGRPEQTVVAQPSSNSAPTAAPTAALLQPPAHPRAGSAEPWRLECAVQQSSSSINQRMEAEPALQGLAGNSEGMATTFSGDRSSGLAGAPAGDHVGGWGVRTSSMGGDPSSSENAARCGIPARANEQGTPSSIAHNTAVDANLPARLLAATSEDVMVVESGDDESDVENFEAYPTDTEATGSVEIEGSKENENENENELMEQLLGLWRKLRIENAELRAQVHETSMAVKEANSQLGVAITTPASKSSGGLIPGRCLCLSGSGASSPDGSSSPAGGKSKRGRDAMGGSLLRPRKHVADPEPVVNVDSLKPEELWAMLLRERQARDFYRRQMESNAKLIEQLKETHIELRRQLEDASQEANPPATAPTTRTTRRVSRTPSNAASQGASMLLCGRSSGSISTSSLPTSPALSPRAGNISGGDEHFQLGPIGSQSFPPSVKPLSLGNIQLVGPPTCSQAALSAKATARGHLSPRPGVHVENESSTEL